ncbi:MAG: dihydroneopterin aldolase [Bacteroidia bacterium]|nr:dihydroneopterin aldolase [Bacteroidia bacterium]
MGLIQLENMEFYAYHGHYKEERIVGNHFLVDVNVESDCTPASVSDDLKDALNYQVIYMLVKEQMQIKSNLLEHLCGRIIHAITDRFPEAGKITVKVSKINPPLGGKVEKVSVMMSSDDDRK